MGKPVKFGTTPAELEDDGTVFVWVEVKPSFLVGLLRKACRSPPCGSHTRTLNVVTDGNVMPVMPVLPAPPQRAA